MRGDDFKAGDRVKCGSLTGTVERVTHGAVKVEWDYPGLAISQLGILFDYPNPMSLERLDES
jgi:hypothetical protein